MHSFSAALSAEPATSQLTVHTPIPYYYYYCAYYYVELKLPLSMRLCFHRRLFVHSSVSTITQRNYLVDFHKIRWKGASWAMEETVDGNQDYVTLGSGYYHGYG